MNPLMRMYEFHKREFSIQDNTFLRHFENLLSESPLSILQCSAKISPTDLYLARFRAGYLGKDIQKGLEAMITFIDQIAGYDAVHLNRTIFDPVVGDGLDLSRVNALGIGIDSRINMNDSKVKCYFVILDYPEKVSQVLSLHVPVNGIDNYRIHNNLMFGIEMYFDGRTDVEIYPGLDSPELKDTVLMDNFKFSSEVTALIKQCTALNISFEPAGNRVLYFLPKHPVKFIRRINNRQLSMIFSNIQILGLIFSRLRETDPIEVVLSLQEDEIISKNIQNIDLHYDLKYRAHEKR